MARKRFCAECGAVGVPFHDNFCEKCYWKHHSLGKLKQERLKYAYCGECGSVKLSSGWTGANLKEEIPETIGFAHFNNISTSPETLINIEDISEVNWMDPNPEFTITYKMSSDKIAEFPIHTEILELWIKISRGICTTCIKRKTGSGDITIQFRAKNRKITKPEMDKVTTIAFELVSELNYENPEAYISDIVERYGGIDLYFGNNYLAELFVEKIRNQWISHYEKNYKLVTEDKDDRRIYSTTHLVRIPEVMVGDFIEWQDELFEVIRVSKSGIHMRNVQSNQIVLTKDWTQLKPLDPPPQNVRKMIVSEDNSANSYLIMDLSTYEMEEIDKTWFPNSLPVSDEVSLLKWHGKYYINPKDVYP